MVWSGVDRLAYTESADALRTPLPEPGERFAETTAVLAARRLAILDRTPAGHQPMFDVGGRWAAVFNGEIYNHVELREELSAAGHTFRSRSDTEVLLAAFAEWGTACLNRLVGMFAFAILDTERGEVFLARDAFGMKPLFLTEHGDGWLLASEIGALLRGADREARADPDEVVHYLQTALTDSGPRTTVQGVLRFPPATYFHGAIDDFEPAALKRWWTPGSGPRADVSFDEATRLVRDAFLRSVELHLRSDVPVGLILSGGVDSSAVAGAMREVGGRHVDIHAFSYIGEHGAFSEEPWIDEVVAATGAHAHKIRLLPHDWLDGGATALHQGEPFGSLAVYAQGKLYEAAAAAGIPVALSGQGGDEVFAGYSRFWGARLTSSMAAGRFLGALRLLRGSRKHRTPGDPGTRSLLRQFGSRTLPDGPRRAWVRRRGWSPWIDPEYCRTHEVGHRTPTMPGGRHALTRTLADGLNTGLPILLRYEDRNAMRHSVEGRTPFVSRPLVDLALSLPDEYLIGEDGTTKHVLKEALRGLVPASILDRKDRVGFSVPLASWPGMIPGFGKMIDRASALPPVRAEAVEGALAEMPSEGPLGASTPMVWRLAGLQGWADALSVSFDPVP